jgi:NADPH-dependent 2,4-dienoyl-CoA reductase/sulfur reductase-like enzyme
MVPRPRLPVAAISAAARVQVIGVRPYPRTFVALHRMGTVTHDVLVVGGGVVGAGAALDAASRGLSVALVEARDFAAGTSSRAPLPRDA